MFKFLLPVYLVFSFVLGFGVYRVSIPSVDVDANLAPFGYPVFKAPKHSGIVQIGRNNDMFCSAYVADGQYIITAGHCVSDRQGRLDRTPVQIYDQFGRDTGVVAQPVGLNNRVDVGLIRGDFRNFQPLESDFYGFTPTNDAGQYETCGFPYLQRKLTCTKFFPNSNYGFTLAGDGFLIPGMSGGPVIDRTHQVVIGVNSAMGDGAALIAPVLGLLGAFGIERQEP